MDEEGRGRGRGAEHEVGHKRHLLLAGMHTEFSRLSTLIIHNIAASHRSREIEIVNRKLKMEGGGGEEWKSGTGGGGAFCT